MTKLYYWPGTCAMACWIALDWAEADFEPVKADLSSEDYRRVNPLGMVPALDIGGNRAMTQADAILGHIAEQYPAARLGPVDDTQGRFEFAETMAFLTGDFHPAFWPYFGPQRFTADPSSDATDQVRAASYARIDRVMTHLDGLVSADGHVYRNHRTVADCYAYVMARWTDKLPKPWRDYDNIPRLFEMMERDPIAQGALRKSGTIK